MSEDSHWLAVQLRRLFFHILLEKQKGPVNEDVIIFEWHDRLALSLSTFWLGFDLRYDLLVERDCLKRQATV